MLSITRRKDQGVLVGEIEIVVRRIGSGIVELDVGGIGSEPETLVVPTGGSFIAGESELQVTYVRARSRIRLSINAPSHQRILRSELYDRRAG